jgi:hypothetical protein
MDFPFTRATLQSLKEYTDSSVRTTQLNQLIYRISHAVVAQAKSSLSTIYMYEIPRQLPNPLESSFYTVYTTNMTFILTQLQQNFPDSAVTYSTEGQRQYIIVDWT